MSNCYRSAATSVFSLFLLAAPAFAKVPVFSATCPLKIAVEGTPSGSVRINGGKAKVKTFNASYYEARRSGIIVSITVDNSGLIVSYTKGGANGICTVR